MSEFDRLELTRNYSLLMKEDLLSPPGSTYASGVPSADGEEDEHKCRKGRRKSGSKKHRAGKNRKRKYRPYHKLSSVEQEKRDELIRRRSSHRRERWHKCGVPLAPLNTTQFLVNDSIEASSLLKKWEDEDLKKLEDRNSKKWEDRDHPADESSTSEYDESNADIDEPLPRWSPDDFQEMWSHRYEHLSRTDLVEWWLSLEEEVAQFEEALEVEQKILAHEVEVQKYECEVEALRKLNEKLIKRVKDLPCKDQLAKILEEFPVYGEKQQHLEEDDSPCEDEVLKILQEFPVENEKVIDEKVRHLEEDDSPCKDEIPKILQEFPVENEKVIDEKVRHLEEDDSPCKDEIPKILQEFPVKNEKVTDEKDQHKMEKAIDEKNWPLVEDTLTEL